MIPVRSYTSSLGYSPIYQAKQLAVILAVLLCLHVACMIWLEDMNWLDSLWLTLTTATTVGFGDHAPRTPEGRLATILLIYCGGIVMAARIGGLYFDYLMERRMKILQGKWGWKLKQHIVFLGAPVQGAAEYFKLAIADLRESECAMSDASVVIHSNLFGDGLPEEVRKLNVAHVHATSVTEESLKRASIADASVIVILASQSYEPASDSITFDLIHRLRGMGIQARIIAEAVQPESKPRMQAAGANNIIRPIRSYPELLVRSLIAPGTEQVIEELISHHGATSIRYDIALEAKWSDIQRFFAEKNLGIPIGYVDEQGIQNLSPAQDTSGKMTALIAIVRNGQVSTAEKIRELMQKITGR